MENSTIGILILGGVVLLFGLGMYFTFFKDRKRHSSTDRSGGDYYQDDEENEQIHKIT